MVVRTLEPQHLGPTFKCDQYGLPRKISGIKQPVWVHNRRKILQSLTSKERNILLTGDPFIEFDPFTYFLVYNYPEQIQNYPNMAQNFQHILDNPEAQVQPPTPPRSTSSSPKSSPEKVIMVLRHRTITTEAVYPKLKPKSWIKKGLAEIKSQTGLGPSKKKPK